MKMNQVCALALSVFVASHVMAAGDNQDKALAEKAAKELANPNTAYASLNLKLQYNGGYENRGNNFTTVFQPTLPFLLDGGDKIIFRPAVSYVDNDFPFNDDSGVSDISFDLAYAPKTQPGTIAAFGVIASLPTGSDNFSSEQFAIGQSFLSARSARNVYLGHFRTIWLGFQARELISHELTKHQRNFFG